jgi:hypothetical protein
MVLEEVQNKIDDIRNRLDDISNLFYIYNITDREQITYLIEELNSYKEELKKISDEKLNRTIKKD